MGSGSSRLKEASLTHIPLENSVSAAMSSQPPRVLGNDRFQFSLDTSGMVQPSHPVAAQLMTVLDLQAITVAHTNVMPPRSPSLAVVQEEVRHKSQLETYVAPKTFSIDDSRSTNSATLLSDGTGDRHRGERSLALAVHRSLLGSASTEATTSGVVSIDAFYQPCIHPTKDAFDCSGTLASPLLLSSNPLRRGEEATVEGGDRSLISSSDNRPDGIGWSSSTNRNEVSSASSRLQLPTFTATSTNHHGRMMLSNESRM